MQSFQPSTITDLPLIPASIHFVGIGGVSMSGLARILHAWGYTVSGSDRQASPVTEQLASLGIRVQIGHDLAELAGEADILVITPRAIPGAPEEIRAAVANGAQIVRRGQLLGMLANARTSIAVAGSHGKSSTSGMVTSALTEIGVDPSYSVGAIVNSTGKNADSGTGNLMVVEADEFDRALLWLTPDVAVVTTISFDHPDIFVGQSAYDQAFADFASQVRPGGTLIVSADDVGSRRLLDQLSEDHDRHYSIQTFAQESEADWTFRRAGTQWELTSPDGQSHQVDLKVPGRHNAANATAAVMAMVASGVQFDDAIRGVEAFTGVGRRFELKGSVNGIEVIDDYGHHPDEISATIAGARDRYPDRRIVVLFQPHTFSRTAILLHEFAASLDRADLPVLLDIYPAGEENTYGVTSQSIADGMSKSPKVIATPGEAVTWLTGQLRPGDVVITMGAGDVTVAGDKLLRHLGAGQEPARSAPAVQARGNRPIRSGGRKQVETIPLPGTDATVQRDVDMSLHTTMRVGGTADYLVRASTPELLEAVLGWAATEALPVTVIGGGSNLLVGDGGIRGLTVVVRTPGQKAEALLQVEDHDDHVLLTVGAQAPISWVGRYCAEHGWSGMDWAVGLPGQIGGATVNNAGAHGTEIKDHLVGVDVFEDGDLREYDAGWLAPSYRMTRMKDSDRPRPWTIVRSSFQLPKGDPVALVALADDHARFRRETQPTGACSGSTFANPEGDYAGRLLEEAGLKGYQIGTMQFSPKHANWVVNTGNGTARDAWALIQHARSTILERYAIDLRPELERVGDHAK